jgi:hypothetical protein
MAEKRNHAKQISPAALHALKEALTYIYWYKSDLRSFLSHSLQDPQLIANLNWDDYKRNVVGNLVDFLAHNEDVYQRKLLKLMTDVSKVKDFSHLSRVDDGEEKIERAEEAVKVLKEQIKGLEHIMQEEKEIERRREKAHQKVINNTAVKKKLKEIKQVYYQLLSSDDPQQRGYQLEKVLKDLFELFDLDPKASFKIKAEQIDGAFTFDNTDYLLECKWKKGLINAQDLDGLTGKLSRKLENTLGLFLSINGFSQDAVDVHSSGRSLIILMDGSDLMAVLEGRIDFIQLLLRKRRAAAQKGNIYLRIHEILVGET